MAKKDDIILIIAKSFSKAPLTEKECEDCNTLSVSSLIEEYGLTDIQASEVINWCVISNRKLKLEKSQEPINEIFGLFKKKKSITKEKAQSIIVDRLGTRALMQYLHMIKVQLKRLDPKMQLNVNVDDGVQYDNVRTNPKAFQLNRLIKENLEICYDFFDNLKRNPSLFNISDFKVVREGLENTLTQGEIQYLNAVERSLDEPNSTSHPSAQPVTFRNRQYSMLRFSKIFNNHLTNDIPNDTESLKSFTYLAYKVVMDSLKDSNSRFKNKRDERAVQFERENKEAVVVAVAEACLSLVEKTMDVFEESDFYKETKHIYNKFMTSKTRDRQNFSSDFGTVSRDHMSGVQTGHSNRERYK